MALDSAIALRHWSQALTAATQLTTPEAPKRLTETLVERSAHAAGVELPLIRSEITQTQRRLTILRSEQKLKIAELRLQGFFKKFYFLVYLNFHK